MSLRRLGDQAHVRRHAQAQQVRASEVGVRTELPARTSGTKRSPPMVTTHDPPLASAWEGLVLMSFPLAIPDSRSSAWIFGPYFGNFSWWGVPWLFGRNNAFLADPAVWTVHADLCAADSVSKALGETGGLVLSVESSFGRAVQGNFPYFGVGGDVDLVAVYRTAPSLNGCFLQQPWMIRRIMWLAQACQVISRIAISKLGVRVTKGFPESGQPR